MSLDPMAQLRVIWTALVGGVAVYTVVAFGLIRFGGLELGVLAPGILNIVAASVIVYMAGGALVRRTLIARIPANAAPEVKFGAYRTATILALAVTESGGLVVITLGMLGSRPTWIVAGGAAACAMMLLARPDAEEIP